MTSKTMNSDQFTKQASTYAQFRPRYPDALFTHLASLCSIHERALDIGTGNGQAAECLSQYFQEVLAIDPNEEQLSKAKAYPRVRYQKASAEETGQAEASFDLITVAQAAHWFDLKKFYAEVERIARPGAILALWCYPLPSVNPEIDTIVNYLYEGIVGPYWFKERRFIDEEYKTLFFPFENIAMPEFFIDAKFGIRDMLGYLGTWSAVQHYQKAQGKDPLDLVRDDLCEAWGAEIRALDWPLYFRVTRVGG